MVLAVDPATPLSSGTTRGPLVGWLKSLDNRPTLKAAVLI